MADRRDDSWFGTYPHARIVSDGRPCDLDVAVADTPWRRVRGLLGLRVAAGALLIEPCPSIHCMGMSMEIDVVYLDEPRPARDGRVATVLGVETVAPNRLGHAPRGSRSVMELASGASGDLGLLPGARVRFVTLGLEAASATRRPRPPA